MYDDGLFLHSQSYYSGDESQEGGIYRDSEESFLDFTMYDDKPYLFEKLKKMTRKCNVKYQQNKGKEPETEICLSESELDKIDEILEKINVSNQDKKQKYKSLIEKTFEAVKIQFLGRLEQEFEDLFDFVENYSEISLFEELVQKFQDNKSEYEMDQSTQNTRNLQKTLKNVFSFDQMKNLYLTLDDPKIETLLDQTSLFYQEFLRNIKRYWPKETSTISKMIKDIKNSTKLLFDFLREDQDLPFRHILVNYQIKENTTRFVNSELKKFKPRLPFLDQEISSFKEEALRPNFISYEKILKIKDEQEDMKLNSIHLLKKNQDSLILEFVDNTNQIRNNTKLYLVSLKDKENKLSLIKEIGGKIQKLLISPNDNFLAIKFSKEENTKVLVYSLFDKTNKSRFFISKILKNHKIKSFLFLDSVEGLRFVFTDDLGGLNIVNLETLTFELRLDYLNLISIHYVNDEQILVINKCRKIGVFSIKTKSVCNFIETNVLLKKTYEAEIQSKTFYFLTKRNAPIFSNEVSR